MELRSILQAEFDQEMAGTRKVLERVPEEHLGWKPHVKSWTLAELATHVAFIPAWTVTTLQADGLDMAAGAPNPKPATSRLELLELFDRGVEGAKKALAGATDDLLRESWSLRRGEQVFFALPKGAVLRSFVLNHGIHHRGQLEVYLRLKDVPLPSLYGPSADEGMM